MRRRVDIPSLDGLRSDDALRSKFDVRDMVPEALLFQSGYLTIRGEEAGPRGRRSTGSAIRTTRCAGA